MARSRGYNGGSNRSDLNTKLPVATAPSQQYGAASQQQQAQKQVPMASGPPPAQVAQTQQQAGTPSPLPQAMSLPGPGGLPALGLPSERPNEPVTQGAAAGPGAGLEALMGFQTPKLSQTIAQIAQTSGNGDLLRLAQQALSQGN